MVEDSRETVRTETVKPVNIPELIMVEEDAAGLPVKVKTSRKHNVAVITDRWRVDDEWWRTEPLSRLYFSVILASGQKLVIFKDLSGNRWFRQTY